MTTNLTITGPASDRKAAPASTAFGGKSLPEPLQKPDSTLQKLLENLRSCTSEGFELGPFIGSITSVSKTSISGGPAMILETGSGTHLLYKEVFQGSHLVISGLIGSRPTDAKVLKTAKGDTMYLAPVPENKRFVLDINQS